MVVLFSIVDFIHTIGEAGNEWTELAGGVAKGSPRRSIWLSIYIDEFKCWKQPQVCSCYYACTLGHRVSNSVLQLKVSTEESLEPVLRPIDRARTVYVKR